MDYPWSSRLLSQPPPQEGDGQPFPFYNASRFSTYQMPGGDIDPDHPTLSFPAPALRLSENFAESEFTDNLPRRVKNVS